MTGKTIGELTYLTGITSDTKFPVELCGYTYHINYSDITKNLPLDIYVTGGTYSNGTATFSNNTGGTFNVTGFISSAYTTIQDEGTTIPSNDIINFIGSGVSVSNVGGKATVDIPGNVPSTSYGLYSQTSLGTIITDTIVETSLIGSGVGTLSVPANGFNVGDSFTVKMCGNLSCANNETIHIRVKSNGIIIADVGVFEMKLATNKYFELLLDLTVTKLGGPGVGELFVNGQYSYNQNVSGLLSGNNFALISNTTFDTTVINALTITAQWGLAKPANSIQSQNFILQKVY